MDLGVLESRLGHTFHDPELLRRAMCHRSWVAESDDKHSNERLEFLGDAVLGWVIADLVFRNYSDQAEGALTDLRKSVVNATALAEVAAELHIGDHLLLGRGEDAAGGREKVSILSDAMEAVLGAVYLDGGAPVAFDLVERLFAPRLDAAVPTLDRLDFKSALQELVSHRNLTGPDYAVRSTGPDHDKRFHATVKVAKQVIGEGDGRSKKSAEQAAASAALRISDGELMPELPEVETVRRGLDRFAVGRQVERVEVGRERTVRRTSRQALIDGLTGSTITAANRHGKYLRLPLDTGDEVMIHLRMSGQVLIANEGAVRPAHTHVVLHLAAGGEQPRHELWFVDPRTFGEVVVFDPDNVAIELPELDNLGVDPIAGELTLPTLRRMLRSRHRLLKPLLLDQHVIAGIGNIYADEILHEARLRPDRMSDELGPAAERRLHAAIHRVLEAAIAAGGSTLGDAQYVDLYGEWGSYQEAHKVYGRAGERCLTCGVGWIRRTVSAQRSTYYCPRCQR